MIYRLAIVFAVALLAATTVLAQERGRELELGGGWFQFNPLGIGDLGFNGPSGPSVNLAWTTWLSERTGITVGVTPILARLNPHEENELIELAFPIYGHFTWRRRWLLGNGPTTAHFGLGTGPMAIWRTDPITKWSTELQTFHLDGSTESGLKFGYMWHAELLVTGHVRDGLDLRAGVTFTPLLHVPMTLQPVVMAVWEL